MLYEYSYLNRYRYHKKMGFSVYKEYIIERDGPWRFARVRNRWRHTQACRSTWICAKILSLKAYK